jgi:diphthine-ammonia ligase
MNLEYTATEEEKKDDEVEDLFEVLKEVKEKYPDVIGVSSGAIASTYQKLRVENM